VQDDQQEPPADTSSNADADDNKSDISENKSDGEGGKDSGKKSDKDSGKKARDGVAGRGVGVLRE
jgi:hypothetical protein